ncbi:hypothetical protein GW17_00041552 [Ensete ventricosum]|nr:hypothetical protein GW17_00041552 [Ensete ventricosum]
MTPGAPCGPPTPPVMGSAATSACSTAATLCCTPPTPQRCLAEQHPQGTRELHPRAAERPEPCDVWPSTLGHRHESSSRCGLTKVRSVAHSQTNGLVKDMTHCKLKKGFTPEMSLGIKLRRL